MVPKYLARCVSITVMVCFVSLQVGCAKQAGKPPKHRRATWGETAFEDDYTYRIYLREERTLKAKGRELEWRGIQLKVPASEPGKVYLLDPEHVRLVEGVGTEKLGTKALKGMGIGALGGLVIGGVIAGVAFSGSCDSRTRDCGDVRALGAVIGIVSLIAFPIFGSLVGLGIGALIPRRPKITIQPTNVSERSVSPGIAVSGGF